MKHLFLSHRLVRPVILFFVVLALSATAFAAPLAERETLKSGMVLLHSEKRMLPIVRISLAVPAGQIEEVRDKAGLAALTASLLKEGTHSRTADRINEAIEFVGGSLSCGSGGEYATLSLTVLKKDLDLGFDLLTDILRNPSFPDAQIQRKKKEFLGRLARQREMPASIADRAFDRELYGEHPFSWPPEGSEESLAAITREDILAFHKAHYRPDGAWMAVVGDVSRAEILDLIDRYLADWKPAGPPVTNAPAGPAFPAGPRVIRIDKDVTQASILLGHPGVPRTDPDYYAILVMNHILGGGGFSSRLMDNIRDDKGLVYDIRSGFAPYSTFGSFEVSLQTKNESAGLALSEILKEIQRIRTEPVSEKELADAVAYITGSLPLRLDSNAKIADTLLSVEHFGLGMNYVEDYVAAVRRVTRDDVLRVAKKHLQPDRTILVVVGRQGEINLPE